MEDPGSHIRRGLVWLGSAAAFARVIDLLALVAVLFFLTKEEVGVATVVWAFGMLMEAVSRLGLSLAILQAKDISRTQLDSAFWSMLLASAVLGGGVILAGPYVGPLFHEPAMGLLLVPAALKLLFLAWATIPVQLLNRELQFKTIAGISTAATLLAALSRVALAAWGAGEWTLLIAHALHGVFMWAGGMMARPFWPRLTFRFKELKPLLRFGFFTAGDDLVYQLYRNVDYLILGAFAGPSVVGVYRVAFDIAMEPAIAVGDVIKRTGLSVLSRLAQTREKLADAFQYLVFSLCLVIAPVSALVFAGAFDLSLLIGDGEYIDAGEPARILALAAFLRVIYQLFPQLFVASGIPRLALAYGLLSLVVLGGALGAWLYFLPREEASLAMSYGWITVYVILLLAVAPGALKRIGSDVATFLRKLWPGAVGLVLAGGAGVAVSELLSGWPAILRLAALGTAVLAIYAAYARGVLGIRWKTILSAASKPS